MSVTVMLNGLLRRLSQVLDKEDYLNQVMHFNRVRWSSLQSDQNLRGPRVARQ